MAPLADSVARVFPRRDVDADDARAIGHGGRLALAGEAGPTGVLVPKQGFSVTDVRGGPFWDPEADGAFISALLDNLDSRIRAQVIEAHINDEGFAEAAVDELLALSSGAGDRKARVSA